MKKLGIAYNIFDGEELLANSLENMRNMVDFICVVYQTTSNFGHKNNNLKSIILELKEKGLIDKFYEYEPNFLYNKDAEIHISNGFKNEINKRNIGLDICRANDCDIFMTIDCDEFYDKEQFVKSREEFESNDYDSSYCQMKTFYKYPTIELTPPETYYVPLFYKIKKDSKFDLVNRDKNYPVLADPSRCLKAGYVRVFSREEIEMYHYSYVRKDIRSKVLNSSSQRSLEHQEEIISYFNTYTEENDKVRLLGNDSYNSVKKVKNKFNIKI